MKSERKATSSQKKFCIQNLGIKLIFIAFGVSSCVNQAGLATEQPAAVSGRAAVRSSLETASIEIPDAQDATAAEREALTYIGAMNRVQQVYRLENSTFTANLVDLEAGIPDENTNYRFQIIPQGDQTRSVMHSVQALQPGIRSFSGAVFVTSDNTLRTIICASDQPSTTPLLPILPEGVDVEPRCRSGSTVAR